MDDLPIFVVKSTKEEGGSIIFYSVPMNKSTQVVLPLGNVEEEEDWLTSCVVLDPKLSHLLRQSGLYLSENGQLPPRPPIFDKLRSPSEFRED